MPKSGAAYTARKLREQAGHGILYLSDVGNGGNLDVNFVCRLDRELYSVITDDIQTDEVIITDQQLAHIRQRHPDISDIVLHQLTEIITDPDYIIDTDRPNTANILKRLTINEKEYQLVLRLKTKADPKSFKNSIITLMTVNEKRFKQYLRNRKILYKRG